jgi:hypothetical protein
MKAFFSIALLLSAGLAEEIATNEEVQPSSSDIEAMASIVALTDHTMDNVDNMDAGSALPSIDSNAIPDIDEPIAGIDTPVDSTPLDEKDVAPEVDVPRVPWQRFQKVDASLFNNNIVSDTKNAYVVAYIDPSCPDCLALEPEFAKVVMSDDMVTRRVHFGYVDITEDGSRDILDNFVTGASIESTPTIYVYGQDKTKPTMYEGEFKAKDIVNFTTKFADTFGFTDTVDNTANPLNEGPGGLNLVKLLANAAMGGAFDIPEMNSA